MISKDMITMNLYNNAKRRLLALACAFLPLVAHAGASGAVFISSDTILTQAFDWAQHMALSYAHDGGDPVGAWYEAALPGREAFCMRDVSHQAIGAHLLGLSRHNKNMMQRFAGSVSAKRDWCSFWEINRYARPCPADYVSDSSFWYNLNANFDVLVSCLKLYQWTGDADYVRKLPFRRFYEVTTHEYVDRWRLRPSQLMCRPAVLNDRISASAHDPFRARRGIPSYTEGIDGLTMSADLVAVMYAAFRAYALVCRYGGQTEKADSASNQAECYRQLLNDKWWNSHEQVYETLLTDQGFSSSRPGIEFLLQYGAVRDSARIVSCLDHLDSRSSAIELLSYQPLLLFTYGRPAAAERLVAELPRMARASYPEVSFAIVEGLVGGLMGLQPDYTTHSLQTAYRGMGEKTAEVRNMPLWGRSISVKHWGHRATRLVNTTGYKISWTARFKGHHKKLWVNGKPRSATYATDIMHRSWSEVTVEVPANQSIIIQSQP